MPQNFHKKIAHYAHIVNNFDQNAILFHNDTITLNKKYKIGKITVHSGKFYLYSYLDAKDFYIDLEDLHGANEGDLILARVIFNPRGRLKVKVALMIEKNLEQLLVIFQNGSFITVKNGNHIHLDHNINPKEGEIYLIDKEECKYFGHINDPMVDEKISLYLYKEEYRLDHYDTKNIDSQISFENRIDLTHLDFCTIDPIGAKDHDDAIYYDPMNSILYVAIADVSHYVKIGTKLDEEAKRRAFSAYFPSHVLPMLPFVLSSDLCSLKPNQLRYAYVCKMEIDTQKLIVKKSEFIEAVIESKNNFSYEMVDEMIETNTLSVNLQALLDLTQQIRKQRLIHGYDFRNDEFRLILDNNEKLIGVNPEHSTISHQLVEECMLLANQESAKKIGNFGIFRVHDEPDMKKIDKLIEDLANIGILIKKKKDIHTTILAIQKEAARFGVEKEVDKLIIKAQQQAHYSSHIGAHFGLGFSHYSHFTSPIRRYSDLTLHRILKTKKVPEDIDDICEKISSTERQIAQMVWDLEGRKYVRWAKEHLHEKLSATITDVGDHIQCELNEPWSGLSFRLINHQGEKLYSKIDVELLEADLISKKITGKLVN